MDTAITMASLEAVQWYDFSIQMLSNRKDFLILICRDKASSDALLQMLHENAFDLKIFADTVTGNYTIVIEFIDTEFACRLETEKNEQTYPPLVKLKNKQIKYVTTGLWTGQDKNGRQCNYGLPLFRLGAVDIAESFGQAKQVQFVAGEREREPSAVVLVYDDWDAIFDAEADEAYNRLMDLPKDHLTMRITREENNTVSLKIWDNLADLEIKVNGLKYFPEEFEKFLDKTGQKESFAFVLGLPTQQGERTAIASTKNEGFEMITVKGYVHN